MGEEEEEGGGSQPWQAKVAKCCAQTLFHRSAPFPVVPYLILGQLITPTHLYGFQPCPIKDHPCIFFSLIFQSHLEF